MTNLLQFTINVWKSLRPPPNTEQLVFEDHISFFVSVDIHVSLFGQQHPKYERAIRLAYPRLFSKLLSLFNPTNKKSNPTHQRRRQGRTERARFKKLKLVNNRESDTCSHDSFPHVDQYYNLQKYWSFLLNYPVYFQDTYYSPLIISITVKVTGQFYSSGHPAGGLWTLN